jgi:paraquat-inducible protein A
VKMVSLASVIPEAALFAFGALTLMFTVVVAFDPRTLWDMADELAERRDQRHMRASHGGNSPSALAVEPRAGDASS